MEKLINCVISHKSGHGNQDQKECLHTSLSVLILIILKLLCNILLNNGIHLILLICNGLLHHSQEIHGNKYGGTYLLEYLNNHHPNNVQNLNHKHKSNIPIHLFELNSLHNQFLTLLIYHHNNHMLLDSHFTLPTLSLSYNSNINT